jgi:secondary thiamine-phosphate synthase enzyme
MVQHYSLSVGPLPRGFHLITDEVLAVVPAWPAQGMLHVFIRHTSAGVMVNEGADPSVLHDFGLFYDRLAPEHLPGLQHDVEGPDDMPAHIKTSLAGTSITVPIVDGRPALGTWQGIYLCEFRDRGRRRDLIVSIVS